MNDTLSPEVASVGAYPTESGLLQPESRSTDSPWVRGLRALLRNRMAMVGEAIIVIWILVAILAPVIVPYDPYAQDIANRLKPPSAQHFFGTDELGRDVFSRVLYGARISIPSGLIVIAIMLVVGSLVGGLTW
jgi:peptide/nickel transport system permease protein